VSPITAYRSLFALTGPLYVVTAFLGRLPLAMSQMGALLLVSGSTGSYAAGGLTAGALAVANAICSPLAGALADRLGQRPVVLVQSVVGGLGLGVLVLFAHLGAGTPALVGAAAATGAFLPQIGPLARVRWRPITAGSGAGQARLVDTAFSYEGAADEASFVLGPALLGVLVVLAAPGAGLLVAATLLVVFGCAFALHPTARLAHAARRHGHPKGSLWTLAFVVLLFAQLLIGSVFGSVQTGTTVLATAAGQAGVAGLVHSVLGVGSVVAGIALAALPTRVGFPVRLLVSAAGLFLLSLPLLRVGTLGGLVVVVLLLGFTVAPYMITTFTVGERIAPPARVGAAMTLLAAATGLGYAVGSALAGRLADLHGHTGAFAVTTTVTAAALLTAAAAYPLLGRAVLAAGVAKQPESPALAALSTSPDPRNRRP
jgi:MFS family permease